MVRDGVLVAAVLIGDLSRVGLSPSSTTGVRCSARTSPGGCSLGDRPPGESTAALPDDAEVCACAGVTAGADPRLLRSLDDGREHRPAPTTGCGGCADDRPRSCWPRVTPRVSNVFP